MPFSVLGLHVSYIINYIIVMNHTLMLSAGCVMSGLVDAREQYNYPPVFDTLIFQVDFECVVNL